MRPGAWAVVAACVVAGCASVAPVPAPVEAPTVPAQFDVSGRLSARRGDSAVAAHFTWTHAPDADRVDVATPLGQTVARLESDGARVRMDRPGQPAESFADWDAVTLAVFGVAVPVDGLAAWIFGAPTPGAASALEHDARGRSLVLRQHGWEIVYAYPDADAARPSRLIMRYPDAVPVEVRIVVDRFGSPS
jgi:outer membrane lipoprotein LolB